MQRTSEQWRPRVAVIPEEDFDPGGGGAIDGEVDRCIGECRSLYTNPLISAATRKAYDSMFEELRSRRSLSMLHENVEFLRRTVEEAQEYTSIFERTLTRATTSSPKWISEESAHRWREKFYDKRLLEYIRKAWVQEHLPALERNWRRVAEKRTLLIVKLTKAGLNDTEPNLAPLLDEATFLSLHYKKREDLVAMAEAFLGARRRNMEKLYHEVKGILKEASSGRDRYLHPQKVGVWLRRIFTGGHREEEVRAFLNGTFETYRQNWMRVRGSFDALMQAFHKEGPPRGFFIVTLDEFLWMDFPQRETYLEEAMLRLEKHEGESEEMSFLKVQIRHDLDTKDWEGAEILLLQAELLSPDDIELVSMEKFLRAHRTDSPETTESLPHPQLVLDEMRSIIRQLPTELQWLYTQALESGYAVFSALCALMYNRVWCHVHGYLDTDQEREEWESDELKERTLLYMEEGHSDEVEKNIIAGETAEGEAIREECTTAQILYVGSGHKSYFAVMEEIEEMSGDKDFRYWTSLVPMGVPYSTHSFVVSTLNNRLKKGLRHLESLDVPFSMGEKLRAVA